MMNDKKDYPADVKLMNLYEKKSKAGNTFFTGKIGQVRYSLLKTKFTSDDGEPVWELKISQVPKTTAAPEYRPQQQAAPQPKFPSPPQYDDFSSEFNG